jgi:hypothetical protein
MNNSLKEKIRYWFEFLRLAHESKDPIVVNALRSNDVYEKWGDYRSVKFNSWWSSHSSLFKNEQVLSIPQVGEIVDSEFFYVKIPFTYAPTSVGKIVADIYDRELTKRVQRTKKSRKIYQGDFKLTSSEYQVAQFHYYLVFTKDVYLPLLNSGKRQSNFEFVEKSKEVFQKLNKKTTVNRDIPFTKKTLSYESESRLVRRYRQCAEKLLRNVAQGKFPGDYEETFIKNQTQLRIEKAAKEKNAPFKQSNRIPKHSRTGPKIKNEHDPYAGAVRKTRSDKGLPREKKLSK